jgi:single-stranded DNA-binding protein
MRFRRTLVYLEGDASMQTYEDKDGQSRSSLNLIQSKIEVLKRPQPKEETSEQ